MDRAKISEGLKIMIVAALDVGTNTSDLVIIEKNSSDLDFKILYEGEQFIKLGEGVSENNVLLDSAMLRALVVIKDQVRIARELGANEIRIAATSASRDANNAQDFAERVRKEVDLSFKVVSGREEASLTFNGAVSSMNSLPAEVLVFDIGGGSTEFSWGRGKIGGSEDQTSLQIGAIRLSERFFTKLPPPIEEREASRAFVDSQLEEWIDQLEGIDSLLASAGSTPAKLAEMIESENKLTRSTFDDLAINYQTVSEWERRVSSMSERDILEVQGGALKGREKYFLSGIIVLEAIMRKLSFEEFLVSTGGVALGVALAKKWG